MGIGLSARDVLEQLDDDARLHSPFFPDFDSGCNYHVDGRLSVYADATHWVIAIEQLAVNPRAWGVGGVHTQIYHHGNAVCLPPQPGWGEHAVLSLDVIENGPSGPLLEGDGSEEINLAATDVRIRGQVIPIRTDSNYYWARNIDVESITHEQIDKMIANLPDHLPAETLAHARRNYESMRGDVGRFRLRTWHLLRGLVPEHRELLLATEAERRRGVPADLPLLLKLDDWEHPRLLEGELPSGSDSFKQIARVIAKRDPRLYEVSDEGNVHWRNWPNSGSL
jgi:hypothetical protein